MGAEPPRYLSWVVTLLVFVAMLLYWAGKSFFSVLFPLALGGTLGVMLMNTLPPDKAAGSRLTGMQPRLKVGGVELRQ